MTGGEILLRSVGVLVALVLGATLTWRLEPRVLESAGVTELGPAAGTHPQGPIGLAPNPDVWLYPAGPIVAVLGVLFGAVVIPLGPDLVGQDLGIGVFYFIVVIDFVVLGLSLGGWGANVRNAAEVYYRAVAQLVSYVVPLGLAYIGAIMMAGSLSTIAIAQAQEGLWFVVLQPLGFALYLVTGAMQAYRPPFVEPFSRHIEHGVYGSSAGWQALLWRLSMSGVLLLVAAMGSVLYLGGWNGPLLPDPLWMILKTLALMVLMLWLGARFRPLSTAEMLALSWKVLTPVGLANVLLVGGLILLGAGP